MSDNAALVTVVAGLSATVIAVVFLIARAAVEALRITRGQTAPDARMR